MREGKRKMSGKILTLISCIVMMCCLVLIIYADNQKLENTAGIDESKIPVIEESVTIGGKTYTKDRPLKVVELVSEKYQAELGYQMGDNLIMTAEEATKYSVIGQFNNALTTVSGQYMKSGYKVQLYGRKSDGTYVWKDTENDANSLWEFFQNGNGISDYRFVRQSDNSRLLYRDNAGNIYETKNLFAVAVFGDINMADKISYEIMTIDEFNAASDSDVDGIDLLYFNTSGGVVRNSGDFKTLYEKKNGSVEVKSYKDLGKDMNADRVWSLYRKVVDDDLSIIFDTGTPSTYMVDNGNMIKLIYMLNGADKTVFKTHFWQTKDSDTRYHGTFGRLEVDMKEGTYGTINLFNSRNYNRYAPDAAPTEKKMEWNQFIYRDDSFLYSLTRAFGNDEEYWKNYYLVSWGGDDRSGNVWDNVLFAAVWNDMISMPGNNLNYSGEKTGSSNADLYNLYGYEAGEDKKITVGSAIRYILGDYTKLIKGEDVIKVLEIQPSGVYEYTPLDKSKVLKIFRYFRITTKGLDLDDTNFGDYVKVKSVAMNEFIGMTEDIVNNYDFVIIGDYNPEGYLDTNVTKIYSKQGQEIQINDYLNQTGYTTAFSGNDLTDKAYEKLIEYIKCGTEKGKTGKPLLLADSIYNGNTDIVSSDSNVYKLSYDKLSGQIGINAMKNIMDASNVSNRALKYYRRPAITVNPALQYSTDGNGVAVPNVDRAKLKALQFTGTMKYGSGDYTLRVYVDKDANGFYKETVYDDNELLYSGNVTGETFSVVLDEMSEYLRGYLGWKAVLTDNVTGMSSEDTGAFVVAYSEDEVRTVKVLQITPDETDKVTLSLDDGKFLSLFESAEKVSGLKLDLTILTASEFEALYEENPYRGTSDDILCKKREQGYDILVLGFADIYRNDDISNEHGALDDIKYYIDRGNSVLMAHDVLSFTSYSDKTEKNKNVYLGWLASEDKYALNAKWSYNITGYFRNVIGMDRYGITTESPADIKYPQAMTNGFLQKVTGTKLYTAMGTFNNNATTVTRTVDVVNQGQITAYPYAIDDKLSVADTHAQYFQLDLEKSETDEENDVVVWYTLGEGDKGGYNVRAGKDTLNNYYIYSKGNITYSGAGHSVMTSDSELKLFVNTIIRAIGVGNNIPVVSFENAIQLDDETYEMYVRGAATEIDMSALPKIDVTFVAFDRDLPKNGQFKEAYLFFDENKNGIYDDGEPLFEEYTSDTGVYLKNNQPYTVNIMSYLEDGSNKLTQEQKLAIKDMYESNSLTLTVEAVDRNKGVGISTLNIINKELFELN